VDRLPCGSRSIDVTRYSPLQTGVKYSEVPSHVDRAASAGPHFAVADVQQPLRAQMLPHAADNRQVQRIIGTL
jgi:hypothetical protein